MLTNVSRIILMLAWVLTSLTILMILKALTTVAAVEKLDDPAETIFNRIPISVPMTTIISNKFHAE